MSRLSRFSNGGDGAPQIGNCRNPSYQYIYYSDNTYFKRARSFHLRAAQFYHSYLFSCPGAHEITAEPFAVRTVGTGILNSAISYA